MDFHPEESSNKQHTQCLQQGSPWLFTLEIKTWCLKSTTKNYSSCAVAPLAKNAAKHQSSSLQPSFTTFKLASVVLDKSH
jgi:hypothetical protein